MPAIDRQAALPGPLETRVHALFERKPIPDLDASTLVGDLWSFVLRQAAVLASLRVTLADLDDDSATPEVAELLATIDDLLAATRTGAV